MILRDGKFEAAPLWVEAMKVKAVLHAFAALPCPCGGLYATLLAGPALLKDEMDEDAMAMTAFKQRGRFARLAAPSAILLSAALLGGCATSTGPIDVTRFHTQQVARQGTIAIVPGNPGDASSLEFRTTANAVSAALARNGFSPADQPAARPQFEAVVDLMRETLSPAAARRSPVSVGVGGSTGSYGSGLGLGIGIDLSGKPKPVIATRMRVQMRRAGSNDVFWEGRAETYAKEGSPAAQPGMAAGRLADALFQGFPGQSGETITVK